MSSEPSPANQAFATREELLEHGLERIALIPDETCAICMDAIPDVRLVLCQHSFCQACVEKGTLRSRNCPLCRRELYTGPVGEPYVDDTPDDTESEDEDEQAVRIYYWRRAELARLAGEPGLVIDRLEPPDWDANENLNWRQRMNAVSRFVRLPHINRAVRNLVRETHPNTEGWLIQTPIANSAVMLRSARPEDPVTSFVLDADRLVIHVAAMFVMARSLLEVDLGMPPEDVTQQQWVVARALIAKLMRTRTSRLFTAETARVHLRRAAYVALDQGFDPEFLEQWYHPSFERNTGLSHADPVAIILWELVEHIVHTAAQT